MAYLQARTGSLLHPAATNLSDWNKINLTTLNAYSLHNDINAGIIGLNATISHPTSSMWQTFSSKRKWQQSTATMPVATAFLQQVLHHRLLTLSSNKTLLLW
jgi:hypothetical protein